MKQSINLPINKIVLFCLVVGSIAFIDLGVLSIGAQFIAIGYSFCEVLKKKTLPRYVCLSFVWVICFFVLCLLSGLWAKSYNVTVLSNSIAFAQFGCILLSILVICRTQEMYEEVLKYCIVAAVIICIRFVISVPISQWGSIRRSVKTGIFSSNNTAEDLALISIIMIWKAFIESKNSKKLKFFSLLFSAIVMFIVLMMGTKKGILIFGIGIIILYLSQSKNLFKSVFRIFVICIACFLCYKLMFNIPIFYQAIGKRIEGMFEVVGGGTSDGSTRARMAFIEIALKVFLSHPFIGVGIDGFRYENTYEFTYSHTNYVEILANLGMIGFLLYYSIFAIVLKKSIKRIRINLLPFVLIIVMLVVDLFSVTYFYEDRAVFLAITIIPLCLNLKEESEYE